MAKSPLYILLQAIETAIENFNNLLALVRWESYYTNNGNDYMVLVDR